MTKKVREIRRRVGGRSARVQDSVLKSVFELLREKGPSDLSIADVAERAGVHETSIYRRWPSRHALILDACRHFIDDALPIPDTGALRSDLIAFQRSAKAMLGSRQGQVIIALNSMQEAGSRARRHDYWKTRLEQLRVMLDRAVERGEFPAGADRIAFLEALIAPIYFRLLVTNESLDTWSDADHIDRLLTGLAKPAVKKAKR
jgi:AcrR family transcriptional regulator